jgi:hypothetical protein
MRPISKEFRKRHIFHWICEVAYKASIQGIRNLMKLGQEHRVSNDFMPKTLIVAMLDKGPGELFSVDTVYKAAKLKG